MDERYKQITDKISTIIPLGEEDKRLIESLFEYEKIGKDDVLVEEEKVNRKAYFILSGYMRYFKTLPTGEELIIHLYAPNNFAASMNSFFCGTPSKEILQAVTDCEVLTITRDRLEELYNTSPKWQLFGRKLMESFLIEKEERIIDQISLTGQQRYQKLLKVCPNIIQNVQVKYIASFLGLKPESLSRIKKQIN